MWEKLDKKYDSLFNKIISQLGNITLKHTFLSKFKKTKWAIQLSMGLKKVISRGYLFRAPEPKLGWKSLQKGRFYWPKKLSDLLQKIDVLNKVEDIG